MMPQSKPEFFLGLFLIWSFDLAMLIGIELLRSLASFSVILWHYQHFAFEPFSGPVDTSRFPLFILYSGLYYKGLLSVQLFWLISGYIFNAYYLSKISNSEITLYIFFVRRIARLYPLHILTLCYVAFLQFLSASFLGTFYIYKYNNLFHFILGIFMASFWGFQHGFSFNAPFWSVSIETIIYIFFFLHSFLFGYSRLHQVFIFLFSLTIFIFFPDWDIIKCLTFFYAGALIYWLSFYRHRLFMIIQYCMFFFFALYIIFPMSEGPVSSHSISQHLTTILACSALMWSSLALRPVSGSITQIITYFGSLTYCLYLVHFPVQLTIILTYHFYFTSPPYGQLWFFVSYLALLFGISILVNTFFELPAKRLLLRIML